jgi:thiol-disulfide isomerase/thioredoxin
MAFALGALAGAPSPAIAGEGEAKGGETAAAAAESTQVTTKYVASWLKMPSFSATQLPGEGDQAAVAPKAGRALVVVFLASWCEPCQQMLKDLQRVEKRYRPLNTDFVYVFTHDTRDDAEGFMKEFGMFQGYLANKDVLKTFHNPELPTIYIGDRHGWLAGRYLKADAAALASLDNFLKDITAY